MHKDYKEKRKQLVTMMMERQYAKNEEEGRTGAYVHKLREKPYALIYAEKVRKLNEQRTKS